MATFAQFHTFGPFTEAIDGGWKLYHYEPGTQDTRPAYADHTKSTTVAQPLVADANGVASAYFDGRYDLVVKDADGNTLYTWYNVLFKDGTTFPFGEGAAIASATILALPNDGNFYYHVTGTTTIEQMYGTQPLVVLTFDSTPTLLHSTVFKLRDNATRVAFANETVIFVLDDSGTNTYQEIGSTKIQSTPTVTSPTISGLLTLGSGGLKFPASNVPSGQANTLDDYEVGTWTPAVGGTATYTEQVGQYIKIGSYVFFAMKLVINAIGSGSTTVVSGLPFACATAGLGGMAIQELQSSANNVVFLCGQISTTSITLKSLTAAGASLGTTGIFGNGTTVSGVGMYKTDA